MPDLGSSKYVKCLLPAILLVAGIHKGWGWTGSVVGNAGIMNGNDGFNEALTIQVDGSSLRHDQGGVGGFASVYDFDNGIAGTQGLGIGSEITLLVNGKGGSDSLLFADGASPPAALIFESNEISFSPDRFSISYLDMESIQIFSP